MFKNTINVGPKFIFHLCMLPKVLFGHLKLQRQFVIATVIISNPSKLTCTHL